MQFYNVGYIVGIVVSLSIAVWVVLNRLSQRENLIWSFLSVLVGIWFLGRLMVLRSTTAIEADTWQKILYIGAIFLNIVYCHFVIEFLHKKNMRLLLVVGYAAGFLLCLLNLTTHLFIKEMRIMPGVNFYEQAGPLYLGHVLLYSVYPGLGFFWLVKAHFSERGFARNRIDYLIMASLIGFVCGLTSFPMVFGLQVPPAGAPFVGVYQFIIAYAIVQHRFIDIGVIVRKTLIYSVVMGVLAVIYMGTVSIFTHFFEGLTGYQTVFSSALAAGLITVFFQPLRKRVQAFVDRKFFRQYVDREEKLYELSREVITHTTPEAMGAALLRVIDEALHPKAVGLYLRASNGTGFVKIHHADSSTLPERMEEDNCLAAYFKDHPQPFVQDVTSDVGQSFSTRLKEHRENAS